MKLWQIDNAIREVCPIEGVNSDGGIAFSPEATDEQKAAAIALMAELLPTLEP